MTQVKEFNQINPLNRWLVETDGCIEVIGIKYSGESILVIYKELDDTNKHRDLIDMILNDNSSWDDIAKEIVKVYPNDVDALIYCLQDNLMKKEEK